MVFVWSRFIKFIGCWRRGSRQRGGIRWFIQENVRRGVISRVYTGHLPARWIQREGILPIPGPVSIRVHRKWISPIDDLVRIRHAVAIGVGRNNDADWR